MTKKQYEESPYICKSECKEIFFTYTTFFSQVNEDGFLTVPFTILILCRSCQGTTK